MKRKLIGCLAGAVTGFFLGGSFGIVGFGGGIAGTIPFALIGGYAGWRIGSWLDGRR